MEGPDPGEWDVVFEPSKTYLYPQASSLSIKDANDDLFDARCAGPSAYAQPGSRSQGTRSKYEVDDDVSMAAASTEQQGMAATSGAMKGKGKVAEGRKVKGKGKAKPPVQLPDEVWTCIWDWYYKDIAADWQHSPHLRHALLPLLISEDVSRLALPALYQEPLLSYATIDPFIRCAQLPSGWSNQPKSAFVRSLTVQATPVFPAMDSPYVDYSGSADSHRHVHPRLADLFHLFPTLTSLTIRDTLLEDRTQAEKLFAALSVTRPRKARLEIRMWDLYGSSVGQRLLSMTGHGGSYKPHGSSVAHGAPAYAARDFGIPRRRNMADAVDWLDAVIRGEEYFVPDSWLIRPTMPQEDPQNHIFQPLPAPAPAHQQPSHTHIGTIRSLHPSLTSATTLFGRVSPTGPGTESKHQQIDQSQESSTSAGTAPSVSAAAAGSSAPAVVVQQDPSARTLRSVSTPARSADGSEMVDSTGSQPRGEQGTLLDEATSQQTMSPSLAVPTPDDVSRDDPDGEISYSDYEHDSDDANGSPAGAEGQPGPQASTSLDGFQSQPGPSDPDGRAHRDRPLESYRSWTARTQPAGATSSFGWMVPPNTSAQIQPTQHQPDDPPSVLHIHALAHDTRLLLMNLISEHWAPQLRAFSFVAFDPLASVVVRAPSLNLFTRLPIPHIRLHLARSINPLAPLKGLKEVVVDRMVARQKDQSRPNDYRLVGDAPADALGLLHPSIKLFEVEVNTGAEMEDDSWVEYGGQLPAPLCRILAGEHDWRDVNVDVEDGCRPRVVSPPWPTGRLELGGGPASPSTSEYDSPVFSEYSDSEGYEEGVGEGGRWDEERAEEQRRRVEARGGV